MKAIGRIGCTMNKIALGGAAVAALPLVALALFHLVAGIGDVTGCYRIEDYMAMSDY
jgi:hypothetical protein